MAFVFLQHHFPLHRAIFPFQPFFPRHSGQAAASPEPGRQFLFESTILSLIGGVIGIVAGLSLSYGVSSFLNWPFMVSGMSISISFLVCAATGIFFGWYPARKAASLDPINALRYE
jgi:hypothetical protein